MHNIQDMSVFVEIVRCGSISAAGRKLGISPSVASDRLKNLEKRIGVKLLARTTRSQSLTDPGVLYFKKSVEILDAITDMEREVSVQRSSTRGALRITVPYSLGRKMLSTFIEGFIKKYPKIHVNLTLDDDFHDVIGAGFDIAIRGQSNKDNNLFGQWLFDTRLVTVASPKYIDSRGTPKNLESLKAHDCIVLNRGHHYCAGWKFGRGLDARLEHIQGTHATTHSEIPIYWASAGLGITQAPYWEVQNQIESGRLVEILMEYEPEPASFYAIYPVKLSHSRKIEAFVEELHKYLSAESITTP